MTEEVSVVVVLAWWTVCNTLLDVLAVKFVSPPYTAVIVCVATVSALVGNVALPLLRVPTPIDVLPSLKVTVPVGVPAVLGHRRCKCHPLAKHRRIDRCYYRRRCAGRVHRLQEDWGRTATVAGVAAVNRCDRVNAAR